MRKFLVVLAVAVSLVAPLHTTPAHAANDDPVRPQPVSPPGCERSETISDRGSTQCAEVLTGFLNQYKRYADF